MGTGNREKRIQEQAMSKVRADRANRELSMITRDTDPNTIEDLPDWAWGKAGKPK